MHCHFLQTKTRQTQATPFIKVHWVLQLISWTTVCCFQVFCLFLRGKNKFLNYPYHCNVLEKWLKSSFFEERHTLSLRTTQNCLALRTFCSRSSALTLLMFGTEGEIGNSKACSATKTVLPHSLTCANFCLCSPSIQAEK